MNPNEEASQNSHEPLREDVEIFAHEEVDVSEVCAACLLILIEGISYGHLYAEPEVFEDSLSRAYDTLFEETLKRLESKGIHLHL